MAAQTGFESTLGQLITHVITPFFAPSAEHRLAMRLTLASIAAAAAEAWSKHLGVELLAAVLPSDVGAPLPYIGVHSVHASAPFLI